MPAANILDKSLVLIVTKTSQLGKLFDRFRPLICRCAPKKTVRFQKAGLPHKRRVNRGQQRDGLERLYLRIEAQMKSRFKNTGWCGRGRQSGCGCGVAGSGWAAGRRKSQEIFPMADDFTACRPARGGLVRPVRPGRGAGQGNEMARRAQPPELAGNGATWNLIFQNSVGDRPQAWAAPEFLPFNP